MKKYAWKDEGMIIGILTTYFYITDNFTIEKYLNIDNFQYRNILCKFKICDHNLIIESGRCEKTH